MSDAYYFWLIELIGDGYIESNYQKLLWKLYNTEFIYELLYDKNRAADGLLLRDDYSHQYNDPIDLDKTCSVLEMMIALAKKAEDDIMHDQDFGDRTTTWFWMMIENLGLDIYDDYNWYESDVDQILNVFLHHRYAPNGANGGMFSIRKCCRDLRKTDLWWQLNAYFEENYPIPFW